MLTKNSTQTRFTTSADGTEIAYEVSGSGPALVLVDGALCQRSMGPSHGLATVLESEFTVHAYDRRGRGESGPGATPYDIQREVEDLVAVLEAAGGHPHVFGSSSGAVLTLEAARQGAPINRIAAYEAPFIVDDSRPPNDPDLPRQVQAMVDDGRRGDAVKTFLRTVGVPCPVRRADATDARVEEADRRRAHASLRPVHRRTPPAGPAASRRHLRRGSTEHARDRGRQEPRMDAQRPATGLRRPFRTLGWKPWPAKPT